MLALTRRRDSDDNQGTWLIHYDDIRVGSIAMRTGVPIDKDQWGWSVGFYPASDRGLRASGAKTFDAARHFRYGLAVAAPQVHRSRFHSIPAAPRLRCMEARDVGCKPQTADAGGGRPVNVLLWRGDRRCGCGESRLRRAHGERMKFIELHPFADLDASAELKLIETRT
jgi:hypothetical protein